MPDITAPSLQAPKSPKGKVATSRNPPACRKESAKTNSLELASSAPSVVSTPTSSALVDMKGGVKGVHEDEVDGAGSEIASAPSPKRVKSDWEGPHNEEAQKCYEQADNASDDPPSLYQR